MPPKGGAQDPEAHLLVLSLALEEALQREAWAEVEPLMQAREEAIARFEAGDGRLSDAGLVRLQALDRRILAGLMRHRDALAEGLRATVTGRRAHRAYAPPADAPEGAAA